MLECAKQHLQHFHVPIVVIVFKNGVTEEVALELKELGAVVQGTSIMTIYIHIHTHKHKHINALIATKRLREFGFCDIRFNYHSRLGKYKTASSRF
jgi:hypothetical protein